MQNEPYYQGGGHPPDKSNKGLVIGLSVVAGVLALAICIIIYVVFFGGNDNF